MRGLEDVKVYNCDDSLICYVGYSYWDRPYEEQVKFDYEDLTRAMKRPRLKRDAVDSERKLDLFRKQRHITYIGGYIEPRINGQCGTARWTSLSYLALSARACSAWYYSRALGSIVMSGATAVSSDKVSHRYRNQLFAKLEPLCLKKSGLPSSNARIDRLTQMEQ